MRSSHIIALGLFFAGVAFGAGACSDSSSDSPDGGGAGGDSGGNGGDGGEPGSEGGDNGDGGPGTEKEASPGGEGASCAGLAATCGGNKDCCASNVVTGGSFNRSNDPAFPATVSDFKLDVYEVTVGRFRKYVESGNGTQANPPAAGSGAHPKIAMSGWDSSYDASLEPTTADLKAALKCDPEYPAWTDTPGANENKPMNCVKWFDAFSFCIWDGGRLPTETEWNYAAAGGSEQREFPFSGAITSMKAAYDCTGDGSGAGACAFSDMLPVGSRSPQGDGKYGQADLAGNVWEWTYDWYALPYRITPCNDCADLQAAPHRTFRGGGLKNEEYYEHTYVRLEDTPLDRDFDTGFRCARNK